MEGKHEPSHGCADACAAEGSHCRSDDNRPVGTETLAASKAKREAFMAELARLEYEQKAGSLVPIEDVKKQAFKMARIVRDSLLNIPDRLAAELAAETNQFRVHTRLTEELRKALEELGNG